MSTVNQRMHLSHFAFVTIVHHRALSIHVGQDWYIEVRDRQ